MGGNLEKKIFNKCCFPRKYNKSCQGTFLSTFIWFMFIQEKKMDYLAENSYKVYAKKVLTKKKVFFFFFWFWSHFHLHFGLNYLYSEISHFLIFLKILDYWSFQFFFFLHVNLVKFEKQKKNAKRHSIMSFFNKNF